MRPGLYVRSRRDTRDRRHAPGQRPGDLRLRAWTALIVDPGPATCAETLLDALDPRRAARPAAHPHPPRPRGRGGRAGRALPRARGLRARARRAAPGRPDEAARRAPHRLYGDDMERLWGDVRAGARGAHPPAGRRRDRRGAAGGRTPRATPSHHVCYFARGHGRRVRRRRGRRAHPAVASTRSRPRRRPTSTWRRGSTRSHTLAAWNPQTLCLTHFGPRRPTSRTSCTALRTALLDAGRAGPRRGGGGVRAPHRRRAAPRRPTPRPRRATSRRRRPTSSGRASSATGASGRRRRAA